MLLNTNQDLLPTQKRKIRIKEINYHIQREKCEIKLRACMTSNILTKRRMASVEDMFPSWFQLHQQRLLLMIFSMKQKQECNSAN